MKVDAIVFTKPCHPELSTVELPDALQPNEFRAKTLCSGVSIGTERLLWEGRLDYAKFPQVVGYQAVGVVEELGSEVTDLRVGQTVLYRHSLFAGEAVAPVSGCHAAGAVVQRNQALPACEGLAVEPASLFVLPAVGFHGVTMADVRYGDVTVVQGLGLVGLAVVAAARLRGAVVIGIDPQASRREAAAKLGADILCDPLNEDPVELVNRVKDGGADVVFEATGFGKFLDNAFALARRHGKFVFQGNYGADKPIAFQFIPPHGKQLTCFFPCNDGLLPCRVAVTQLMARGAIDWGATISHVLSPSEAVGMYRDIIAGSDGFTEALGVVVDWRR